MGAKTAAKSYPFPLPRRSQPSHEHACLILERIRGSKELELISVPNEFNFLGWVPEDDTIRGCDIRGESILKLADCPAIRATKDCVTSMGLPV